MANLRWGDIKIRDKETQPAGSPTANSSSSLLPAPLLERYTVSFKLGNGSFGTALVIEENATNTKYVAKVMNYVRMTPKERQHLGSEVNCLSTCNHPNIIKHKESCATDTHFTLVTEYAEGGDLHREISERRKQGVHFTSNEIASIFVQVCLAVDHLHQNGILHRDIKPANVFFTKLGLIKLGDFGFSKQYEETLSNPVASTRCGTPLYMSPEMWRGEPYSKSADLWSIGVLLYEMLTLNRPFASDSMKGLQDMVVLAPPPPIERTDVDPELVTICNQLLVKDPMERSAASVPVLIGSSKLLLAALNKIKGLMSQSTYASVSVEMTKHITELLARAPKPQA
eukprot:PhF_6_TR14249/c0_g1_i1/m.22873/K08857/NEK1_4_5; NIMA (never in mitosis gene a)-related kinase 1/4/5